MRRRSWPVLGRVSLGLVLSLAACTTLGDDVRRAERAFGEARYEDVEVWLADLEPSLGKMPAPMRARYYYLAGMSAYRIGQRPRARHALALCREELEASHDGFSDDWLRNMQKALAELERDPSSQARQPPPGP